MLMQFSTGTRIADPRGISVDKRVDLADEEREDGPRQVADSSYFRFHENKPLSPKHFDNVLVPEDRQKSYRLRRSIGISKERKGVGWNFPDLEFFLHNKDSEELTFKNTKTKHSVDMIPSVNINKQSLRTETNLKSTKNTIPNKQEHRVDGFQTNSYNNQGYGKRNMDSSHGNHYNSNHNSCNFNCNRKSAYSR